ncbi:MAG: hypothetical protein GKR88_20660 [Flavobacteriaceae bacterium]|nr:MAG: hypothetical protein GKR88_20660 [Flavobacteriaceae bacterium]
MDTNLNDWKYKLVKSKHTYKLLDYQSSVYEPQTAFEAVSADFEDVKEFIDLEYRTNLQSLKIETFILD